jgi:hypothetical protein
MQQSFLSNVVSYMELQSGAGISSLEWILRYIFACDSRADVVHTANQIMTDGTDEDLLDGVINSQLPAVLSQALLTI